MATVYIPSMLRPVAGNRATVDLPGSTVREIVNGLTGLYPELAGHLLEGGEIRSSISVAIDGEVSVLGMLDRVEYDSEVHFIPAIAGGSGARNANSMG